MKNPIVIIGVLVFLFAGGLIVFGMVASVGNGYVTGGPAQVVQMQTPSGQIEQDAPYAPVNEQNSRANLNNAKAYSESTRANAWSFQTILGAVVGTCATGIFLGALIFGLMKIFSDDAPKGTLS